MTAALYRLAAEVEEATSVHEKWVVEMDAYHGEGRIVLELADCTSDETKRAMEMLQRVATGRAHAAVE